jgi:hypothetical protein
VTNNKTNKVTISDQENMVYNKKCHTLITFLSKDTFFTQVKFFKEKTSKFFVYNFDLDVTDGRAYDYWTSGSLLATAPNTPSTTWNWLTGVPINYDDWGQGEPSSPETERCLAILVGYGSSVKWNDAPCEFRQDSLLTTAFVCEQLGN